MVIAYLMAFYMATFQLLGLRSMTEDNEIECDIDPYQDYNPCDICGYDHDIDEMKARTVHLVYYLDNPFIKSDNVQDKAR